MLSPVAEPFWEIKPSWNALFLMFICSARKVAPNLMSCLPRINHRGNSLDRKRCFCHVCGQNNLALSQVGKCPVLKFGRKIAEQWQQRVPASFSKRRNCFLASHDLSDAGQKYQYMA